MIRFGRMLGLAAVSSGMGLAAVLPDPVPEREPDWAIPGGVDGWLVVKDRAWTARLPVPPLDEKQASVEGEWRLAMAADVFGSPDGGASKIRFEALDPALARFSLPPRRWFPRRPRWHRGR